jgi:hypothetical protein
MAALILAAISVFHQAICQIKLLLHFKLNITIIRHDNIENYSLLDNSDDRFKFQLSKYGLLQTRTIREQCHISRGIFFDYRRYQPQYY